MQRFISRTLKYASPRKIIRFFLRKCKRLVLKILKVDSLIGRIEQEKNIAESRCATFRDETNRLNKQLEEQSHNLEEQSHNQLQLEKKLQFYKLLSDIQTKTLSLPQKSTNDLPMITIIMSAWNRATIIGEAIESVLKQTYSRWQLIIIDDGSTDQTKEAVSPFLNDARIQYIQQDHSGVCAARNLALKKSKSDIIAYLDSDNLWFPHLLLMLANAFHHDPTCKAMHFGAIWQDYHLNQKWIYYPEKLNYDDIILGKKDDPAVGIDMNCFAHRRELYDELGGFDVNLSRLVDYDFTYRILKQTKVKLLPIIGTHYRVGLAKNTITSIQNLWRNLYLIRQKFEQSAKKTHLRVLYILDQYPHLSETYICTEIDYMQRRGVHIEAWSMNQPQSPYPTSLLIHYGSLEDAVKLVQPHHIHAHWLHLAMLHVDEIQKFGLTLSVRGHSFEFSPDLLKQIGQHPAVSNVYAFNHFKQQAAQNLDKVKSVSSCFNPNRYYPIEEKNKNLVLRVAAGLPSKDLKFFIRVASRCKNHHFILAVVRCTGKAQYVDELIEFNRQHNNAVELLVNVLPGEIELLVQKAGIYCHTHLFESEEGSPYGMPVSICEAMATGCYVIGRSCNPGNEYIGSVGDYYKDEDEAVKLIDATLQWSEATWHLKQQQAIDRAYQHFVDDRVLPVIWNDWNSKLSYANVSGDR